MNDLFLVLAQAPAASLGLSCFLLPRVLPDGTRNTMRLQRLKDKLGNKSNASAEVEYDDALAWLVGEEGRGVRTIIEMVNLTRLDCVIAAASQLRLGTSQAAFHTAHRQAFGAALADQPLMANVLADLAVESEAATTVMLRLAGATDRAARGDEQEAAFRRIALAVTKYWVCKRVPVHAAEALECFGGNGYVEESGLPRLYREAPLQSIWEGSGNVAALDALRALGRQPRSPKPTSPRSAKRPGPTRGWIRRCGGCGPNWPTRPRPSCGPGGWWNSWPWSCRAPCWSATATRPWPTPSPPPGWPATGAGPSAPCRPAWTPPPSSSGPPLRSAHDRRYPHHPGHLRWADPWPPDPVRLRPAAALRDRAGRRRRPGAPGRLRRHRPG